jgi:two-component system sensor histidine kinase UhpB
MRFKLTLEGQLRFSIALILLAIVILGCLWSVQDAKKNVREEADASVRLALTLIDASRLTGNIEPNRVHAWINEIRALEKIRHLRIVASSFDDPASLEGERDTLLHDGAVPEWFERAVMAAPILATRELSLGSDKTLHIQIESRAADEIREAWVQTRGFMVLLAIFAVAVYLSVHFIAGRALRPVSRILQGLHQIEIGDYDTPLRTPDLPELQRIVESINQLASTLREARNDNRALTRHSLAIQEEERRTLAKEMHDEVGQNLTAIKMMSAVIPDCAERREHAVREIQRLCDNLFGVVRSMIHRLRPMMLEDLGLKAALEDLADHWRLIAPDIEISIYCHASLERQTGESGLEIYRIVQEALTNIVRHSGASQSEVSIRPQDPHHLLLIVRDNGRGLILDGTRRGFGLLGMRERVASLEGTFQLISQPGQGFEIRIILPVGESQHG